MRISSALETAESMVTFVETVEVASPFTAIVPEITVGSQLTSSIQVQSDPPPPHIGSRWYSHASSCDPAGMSHWKRVQENSPNARPRTWSSPSM